MCPPGRFRDAHQIKCGHRTLERLPGWCPLVRPNRFGDLHANSHHRIQRGHRFLKDHRDVVAANAAHLRFGQGQQVAILVPDATAFYPGRRCRQQSQNRQGGDALAAAGLADYGQGFPAVDFERNAVDCAHHTIAGMKVGAQILYPQNRFARRASGRGTDVGAGEYLPGLR